MMKYWATNQRVKNLFASMCFVFYKSDDVTVIVASSGRSGSTMLSRAIMNSKIKKKLGFYFPFEPVFFSRFDHAEVKNLKKGAVYKTHLTPEYFPKGTKKIFIFGCPVKSKISFLDSCRLYGLDWGTQHLKNLGSKFSVEERFKDVDILSFEDQMSKWQVAENTLCIDIDELWSKEQELNDFLRITLSLPQKKNRKSVIEDVYRYTVTDRRLSNIYKNYPSFKITD